MPDITKRDEQVCIVFITIFMFPLLTFFAVGAFGFTVWIFQMIFGPPSAPLM